MTGGGYGDVDQKEGKFYIGAYLHSLGEETMRNGALRDVASDHPASTGKPAQIITNTALMRTFVAPDSSMCTRGLPGAHLPVQPHAK